MKNELRLTYRGVGKDGHIFVDNVGSVVFMNIQANNKLTSINYPEDIGKTFKITVEKIRPKSGATVIIDENSHK